MEKVVERLKSVVKENDVLIIGCSGGIDSMSLLHVLKNLGMTLKIICANVDHNIREESAADSLFVKEYCQENNIIYEHYFIENGKHMNEALLRKERYKFFKEIYEKYKASYLLTAHHGDDLVETILMRISRGSNLRGYVGIEYLSSSHGMNILRPLLYVTKNDIENYVQKNNIPYVVDKTNDMNSYTRNRYRHEVLPFLKREEPQVHLKYLKFSEELIKYKSFVDEIVEKEKKKVIENNKYIVDKFNKLDDLIQTKVIEFEFKSLYPDNLDLISNKHTELVKELFNSCNANEELMLPANVIVSKEYNHIIFSKRLEKISQDYKIKLEDTILLDNYRIKKVKTSNNTSNYCIRINSEEVVLPLYIRNRKNGDRMEVKNLNGSKKIKDIFIDCKIPKAKRDQWPLLVDSNDTVLWLLGVKKSKFDKKMTEKYDIIIEYS